MDELPFGAFHSLADAALLLEPGSAQQIAANPPTKRNAPGALSSVAGKEGGTVAWDAGENERNAS
ncbi:hypothetical protein KTQ42_18460 [Noviherbaspirillum sp. L7-7A]|uniref:hypothetical protein n=1 Tax=Noviherbaspirillum sp. L7-7A TaxID=2850560 RepID=UPI001C2BF9BE|nr:hypothetical protein [Noviherbaspirillum sp. L7-7A]MBV0881278.1 hypothetical protein [Noviherbaspirillum sp. L7-7A]